MDRVVVEQNDVRVTEEPANDVEVLVPAVVLVDGYRTAIEHERGLDVAPAETLQLGHDALRVTIAHEFHHAVQFGYYQGNDGIWWQESTSTWMEEVAYPEIDDYLQYLPSFLGVPHRALNSGGRLGSDFHIYGTSIFSHFLDQRYNREVNRLIWEELARRASARLEHFDRALRAVETRALT